jgi:hypothetical protein
MFERRLGELIQRVLDGGSTRCLRCGVPASHDRAGSGEANRAAGNSSPAGYAELIYFLHD